MQYHLILTERCNLTCKYCGGTRHIEGLPLDRTYNIDDLVKFLKKDPNPVIGFYGGEPLLASDFLYKTMDKIEAIFTLQTNGILLNKIDKKYLNRMNSILVSIDGGKEITDLNRGSGVYDKVIENCKLMRERGFYGDLIARMVISEKSEVYRDVTHLMNLENPKFDHIHWQLDVFWSQIPDYADFEKWLNNYEGGISKLVKVFEHDLDEGIIHGLVPFIPVLKTLISGEPVPYIRCGSGRNSFTILSNGQVDVCPIAPELSYSNVGNIWDSTPDNIRDSSPIGEPCSICDIKWVCGGHCLFANKTMFWVRPLFDRVCKTTYHMINELNQLTNKIRFLQKMVWFLMMLLIIQELIIAVK